MFDRIAATAELCEGGEAIRALRTFVSQVGDDQPALPCLVVILYNNMCPASSCPVTAAWLHVMVEYVVQDVLFRLGWCHKPPPAHAAC